VSYAQEEAVRTSEREGRGREREGEWSLVFGLISLSAEYRTHTRTDGVSVCEIQRSERYREEVGRAIERKERT
jgi:hypothetical protein